MEFGFNNAYVSGTLNFQQLSLNRYIKKGFYTCRTWSLTQKWSAKSIGNTSDNILKNMSDNTLKTRSELQLKKGVEHNSSRECFQEDHEGSSWENREKLE
jgi:hypothetical protein